MSYHCEFSWILALVLLASPNVLGNGTNETRSKFTAAVYQDTPVLPPPSVLPWPRADAVKFMMKNVEIYKKVTEDAKNQGAAIVVFPEDGIYGALFTRPTIYPFLETIPDPRQISWSPCTDPDRYTYVDIQVALSCLAKANGIYLVANMGDKQPCNKSADPDCPPDGRYQYNTNVAFGPDGTLLARYHKHNLFYEFQFDTAPSQQIWFDTPFGRVGLITCFDILFKEPSVSLVLESNVTVIAFPTAWMDALPLLPSIGFHSAFARALGVNFLGANLLFPEKRFRGDGIYSFDGAQSFYYGLDGSSKPKLLVSELEVLDMPQPNIKRPTESTKSLEQGGSASPSLSEQKARTEVEVNYAEESVNMIEDTSSSFPSVLFYDTFTFKTLDQPSGAIIVCQRNVCCHLKYQIAKDQFGKELFGFGAYDGHQQTEGSYYLQICALVKCADASSRTSCGTKTFTTQTTFTLIDMTATAETVFLYPSIVLSDRSGNLSLTEKEAWTFKENRLWTADNFQETVLAASLYGRDYSKDDQVPGATGKEAPGVPDGASPKSSTAKVATLVGVVLAVLIVISYFQVK